MSIANELNTGRGWCSFIIKLQMTLTQEKVGIYVRKVRVESWKPGFTFQRYSVRGRE